MRDHDVDRAWDMVLPANRARVFGDDKATFDAAVWSVELSGITWHLDRVWLHDGHYHIDLTFDVAEAPAELEWFLRRSASGADLQVRFEPLFGARGVVTPGAGAVDAEPLP